MGQVKGIPRLARWMVARMTPEDDRAYVVGDLDEGFRARSLRDGSWSARRWYWWQALRVLPAAWSSRNETSWTGGRSESATLRQSVRLLVRRPLYSGGVIATLGLGLGAAGAVFAIAWAVWLRPLPFPEPEQLVRVYEANLRVDANADAQVASALEVPPARWMAMSPPLLTDLQNAELRSVSEFATASSTTFDWARDGQVTRITAQLVSPAIFDILHLRPLVGRLPVDDPRVREILLTEAFWRATFGADATAALNQTLVLNGEAYGVVGVIESPAGYPGAADVWAPLRFADQALQEGMRGARYLDVIARLRPGRTVADASVEIEAFVHNLAESHPNHDGWGAVAVPLKADMIRPFRGVLLVLLAAGGVFLLLATVNVAGLVAARRADTRRARSIRIALGASQRQIAREGLSESLLLGLASSAVAALGVLWLLAPIRRLIPRDVPRLEEIGAGPGLIAGLVVAGMLAGLTVGLLGHAMSGTRGIQIARGRDAAHPSVRGRRILLATQVALTTWLLLGGAALVRYVSTLRSVDYGFVADGVNTSFLSLSMQRQGATPERSFLFWQELLDRLAARGVQASIATNAPLSGSSMRFGYAVEGESSQYWGQYHAVTEAYFDVIGTDLVAGRAFTSADREGGAAVVIINERLARDHFPGEDPIGRPLQVVGETRTIVGVARATRHFGPDQEPPAELYVPLAQDPSPFAHVLMRSTSPGQRSSQAAVFAAVVNSIDPDLHVPPPQPFGNFVREWFAPLRLQMIVLGLFASVGAILAALGIYALVAYLVSSGRREIGIRLALGERSRTVFRRVLAHGLVLALIGISSGTIAAVLTRGALSRLTHTDPLNLSLVVGVAAVVAVIALVAAAVPARRAVAVDPVVTLHAE